MASTRLEVFQEASPDGSLDSPRRGALVDSHFTRNADDRRAVCRSVERLGYLVREHAHDGGDRLADRVGHGRLDTLRDEIEDELSDGGVVVEGREDRERPQRRRNPGAGRGGAWSRQAVRLLLSNPVYAGERYGVKGAQPAIVSRRLWNAARRG